MISIQKNMDGTYTIDMTVEESHSAVFKFSGVFKRVEIDGIPDPDPSFSVKAYFVGEKPDKN